MDVKVKKGRCIEREKQSEDEMGIRKGPWSVQEDTILVNYVATHGEGYWNSVARSAGLKRSGKSCRLRWLNYLRPDVRRGNITLQEQLMILDLHSQWGNRWSKIAKHLPGRTDNEIKNYWRTRVIKQAKQLKCDVNSKQFKDTLRYVWMPRLLEKIHPPSESYYPTHILPSKLDPSPSPSPTPCSARTSSDTSFVELQVHSDSGHGVSSENLGHDVSVHSIENEPGLCPSFNNQLFEQGNNTILPLVGNGDLMETMWNDESIWVLEQLCDDIEMKDFLA